MNEFEKNLLDLEYRVTEFKKELRRIKTSINRLGKLGLDTPNELLVKKEDVEVILKEYKQELKELKKVAVLIK